MAVEIVQPILTVIGLAADGFSLITGISQGRQIRSILQEVKSLDVHLQNLSKQILYAPDLEVLEPLESRVGAVELSNREILDLLEPIQRLLRDNMLASRVIRAPEAFGDEMARDPWPYLGWIDPVVLAGDFKLKYRGSVPAPGVTRQAQKTFIDMRTSRVGFVEVFTHRTRTFAVACLGCGRRFFVTLVSNENYVVCPECHREEILDISWEELANIGLEPTAPL